MSKRSDTTAMLFERLCRQVLPKFPIWADEVSIGKHDRWSDEHIRVDFMAYRPKDGSRSIRALECGSVHVFEVKSCMADFNSGHGLNRIGDVNWLVITDKLFEQMIDQNVHTSGWNMMVLRDGEFWGANPLRPEITTGRRIPALQAIWAMLMSPRCHVNGEEVRMDGFANGGTVSESYIQPAEEGSICPIPRASVIFEGQELTFDAEDSEKLRRLIDGHLRKLAGLEVDA